MTTTAPFSKAQTFVKDFNENYANKHEEFENQFWGTKMALASTESTPYSTELLSQTKKEMEDLLSNPQILQDAQIHLDALTQDNVDSREEDQQEVVTILKIIIKTCQCYTYPTTVAKSIREQTNQIEGALEKARNEMILGYTEVDGSFHPTSSVGLRTKLRTHSSEDIRKSAYEGLRSIGTFVCQNGFCEIVKYRNQLAKLLGYEDYYDYTVTNAEGFGKQRLFEILDGLEEGTRPLMEQARKELEKRHGVKALDPWNTSFLMAGSVIQKMVSIHYDGRNRF